ncbi:unnamed product [Ostreococcus tauri]|uniref:Unnamed product n=1 Tax=Ostreococcus tauri TaxID=70448 RepID=A0A090MBF7_OSTTA|nr:unnamed product [Ostreococcus tauri]CEG00919.1 unnamed product [Ostreococcus tauri]|eukprot:XP_022840669.1 unnamed product [Ostreococcus tauri]
MRIRDPSRVRGSGFVQFPPQRPFEGPVIYQPPTVCSTHTPNLQTARAASTPHPTLPRSHNSQKPRPTTALNQPAHVVNSTITTEKSKLVRNSCSESSTKLSRAQAKRLRKKKRDST